MPATSSIYKILSAGVVIVHHDGERYRFLVRRAFGGWDFPKALVSHGEDALDVAMDEARDASGIDELELKWGDEYRETVPHENGSVSRYYMAQSKTMGLEMRLPEPAASEVDFELRWVTADEAEDVLPPRLAIVLDWAVRMLLSGARSV